VGPSAFADAGLRLTAMREFGGRPIPWRMVARLEKSGIGGGAR
jgi:hypothetical protein